MGLKIEILANVRTAQIFSDTTSGHGSTQLLIRDFLKPEAVSIYFLIYGFLFFFLPHFFLAFPCDYEFSINFLQAVSQLPYKLYLFQTLRIWFQFLDLSFCTGRKNEWWLLSDFLQVKHDFIDLGLGFPQFISFLDWRMLSM